MAGKPQMQLQSWLGANPAWRESAEGLAAKV